MPVRSTAPSDHYALPLERAIQHPLENPLAQPILDGEFQVRRHHRGGHRGRPEVFHGVKAQAA